MIPVIGNGGEVFGGALLLVNGLVAHGAMGKLAKGPKKGSGLFKD